MRYPRLKERPPHFRLNPAWHPLKQGLVFAGLGNHPGSVRYEDSGAWKNTGTLTNMDPATDWVWVPELGRWATTYDGLNDYIAMARPVLPVAPLTISAWWLPVSTPTSCIISIGPSAGSTWCGLVWSWSSLSRPEAYSEGPAGARSVWGTQLSLNAYHHVCGTFSGSSLIQTSRTLYVNGVAATAENTSCTLANVANTNIGVIWLGAISYFPAAGGIVDPIIWNRVLTPSEISALAAPSNAMLEVGNCPLILPPRRRLFPAAAIAAGQPTMRRWGGIPHMTPGPVLAGRSW